MKELGGDEGTGGGGLTVTKQIFRFQIYRDWHLCSSKGVSIFIRTFGEEFTKTTEKRMWSSSL